MALVTDKKTYDALCEKYGKRLLDSLYSFPIDLVLRQREDMASGGIIRVYSEDNA